MNQEGIFEGLRRMRILPVILGIMGIGILLVLASGFLGEGDPPVASVDASVGMATEEPDSLDARLGRILSAVEGAGEVDVLITYADAKNTQNGSAAEHQEILGVIVVADGAASYEVRLTLQEAVRASLALPVSRIEVLPRAKMTSTD